MTFMTGVPELCGEATKLEHEFLYLRILSIKIVVPIPELKVTGCVYKRLEFVYNRRSCDQHYVSCCEVGDHQVSLVLLCLTVEY